MFIQMQAGSAAWNETSTLDPATMPQKTKGFLRLGNHQDGAYRLHRLTAYTAWQRKVPGSQRFIFPLLF